MDYRRRRLGEHFRLQAILFLMIGTTVLIQTQLLPAFFGARINLALIAVVCWALLRPTSQAAWTAFYAGMMLDLLGTTPLGSHAFALLSVVGLSLLVAERLSTENWLLVLLMVGVGTLWYEAFLLVMQAQRTIWNEWMTFILVPALVVNLIVTLPEFLVIRWWSERLPRER